MIITVFDWDDTLFPTSACTFFTGFNTSPILHISQEDRVRVRNNIEVIFRKAKIHSDKIFIITNATKNWVELCIDTLYEDAFENSLFLLEDIEIISTQDDPQLNAVSYPFKKISAFANLIGLFLKHKENTLISFGDTEFDRNASIEMRNFFKEYNGKTIKTNDGRDLLINSNLTVKNVKFVETVSVDFLCKEHKFIINNFVKIASMPYHYDKIITDETSLCVSCNDLYPLPEYVIINVEPV